MKAVHSDPTQSCLIPCLWGCAPARPLLWYWYILFPVGDCCHTIRRCWALKGMHTICLLSPLSACLPFPYVCIWTHTHFLPSSLSDHMLQSQSGFHGPVVKAWFCPSWGRAGRLNPGLLIGITRLCTEAAMQSESQPSAPEDSMITTRCSLELRE